MVAVIGCFYFICAVSYALNRALLEKSTEILCFHQRDVCCYLKEAFLPPSCLTPTPFSVLFTRPKLPGFF